ncbi:sugar transferase, partial [Pseudomonas sp. KB_15]|uniref:sugar transferase n=1 Tax=Pseudomonas sp. KB_15 TaxID=3233035 RepID=UPI003F9A5096
MPGAMATFVPPALDGPADMSMRLPPALGLGVKRAFDTAAALTLLLLLSPLMLTVALIVMKDGGPCLFGHTRIGANGRKFKCLKFRSMVMNADVVLKELLASDPVARAEWERDFKLRDDVRITRLGRFIRRTSIDELPQLWNVVRGDMS